MANTKIWVSELSTEGFRLLKQHVSKKLKALELSTEDYNEFMQDLENEKLDNLEELVSYNLRVKYSNLKGDA